MCPLPIVYRPRIADQELGEALEAAGAVLIEGPRGCGKTATARHAAASEVALDTDIGARNAGLLDASVLLDGDRPRLLDEWQLVPEVWNQVRRAVDDSGGQPGSFILTGSAVPPDDRTRHSGAGRILRLRMRPMSLRESGHSTGDISLARLMDGQPARAPDPGLTIRDLARLVSVGGWPALQDGSTDRALRLVRSYLADTARLDLPRLDGVRRDPIRVMRVIESLASYTASTASARAIAADVGEADTPMKAHTVLDYLDALARVFVVEDLPQWGPRLRSRARLRGAPKRHFVDPSIAVAALRAGPERLLREVDTLGLLFESLVIRDLRIHAQAMDAVVRHYQDSTGLEADAIVETWDGRWGAFEVKLGLAAIDEAASSLLRLAERVDEGRHGSPAVLGVITGWGYGYRRPDGVSVIPIGALGS
jgi:predicted AAA+ superfamily ATPase